ncbi:MAG: hypothetical protein H7210_05320 [Pyrinomonadaceae bacterium]|nr:hypothetical protein [Phycisphaerales bacterium]
MSYRLLFLAGAGLIAGAALPAHAAFFSFASDADHASWTFAGNGNGIRDGQDALDPQILVIDDNNGPLAPLLLTVEFQAEFTIQYVTSIAFAGGFIHTYQLDGTFTFLDATTNLPLLSCAVSNGAMTALGGRDSWYTTSTLQVSDNPSGGSVAYTWFGPNTPAYDLLNGVSIGPDDMSFTLTVINNAGGTGVPLGQDHLPSVPWQSEGSYSGSAHYIPSPSAAGLLALAGLSLGRRRREN